MDITTDVNTILANVALTFALQARLAREASAKALEGIDSPLVRASPPHARQMRGESARLAALAEVWQARAAEARRGYLMMSNNETHDTEFMHTYQELISICRNAGRLIYSSEIDADLNAATSPKPGGPIRPDASALPTGPPKDYGNAGNRDL